MNWLYSFALFQRLLFSSFLGLHVQHHSEIVWHKTLNCTVGMVNIIISPHLVFQLLQTALFKQFILNKIYSEQYYTDKIQEMKQ